jgi:hypothetical protein
MADEAATAPAAIARPTPPWRAALNHPAAQIALAAAALAGPTIFNGRPFPFEDTSTYFQSGYRLLRLVFPDAGAPTSAFIASYLAAHSPTYGLLITIVEALGTLWAMVLVHALLAATALRILTRAIGRGPITYAVLIAVLTAGTTLPLFVGFLMPDVTAGFGPLCLAALFLFPDRLARWERRTLWAILAATVSFHQTHLMTAAALMPLALLGARLSPGARAYAKRAALTFAAIAAGCIAISTANAFLPPRIHTPPFLTARVLADGPGRLYLRAECAKDPRRFALCAYRDKPLDYSDNILWGYGAKGVFAPAKPEMRLALIAEQRAFVFGAVSRYPLMEASAALKNAFKQLITIRLDGAFAIDAMYWRKLPKDFYLADMVRETGCPDRLKHCRAKLDLRVLSAAYQFLFVLALIYLAAHVIVRRPWRAPATAEDEAYRPFLVLIAMSLAAIVINAALCGALSGVFPRYQARITWIVPAIAIWAEARFPLLPPAKPAKA